MKILLIIKNKYKNNITLIFLAFICYFSFNFTIALVVDAVSMQILTLHLLAFHPKEIRKMSTSICFEFELITCNEYCPIQEILIHLTLWKLEISSIDYPLGLEKDLLYIHITLASFTVDRTLTYQLG